MTKRDRARFEMFIRVLQFITNNGDDFPTGIVAVQSVVLQTVVNDLQKLAGEQTAGLSDARFHFNSKATARENVREPLMDIVETSRSMVYQFPGIDLKFRMPRNNSDTDLLAKARAFLADATLLKDDFIKYGLEEDFLADLQVDITAFEQAMSAPGAATDSHVEATADIGEEVRKGMVAVRTMDAVIRNKYRGDSGKLAAWVSASHIEREPKPKQSVSPSSDKTQGTK